MTDESTAPTDLSIQTAREDAARRLAERVVGGGLTLDEYAERVAAIGRAPDASTLEAVLADVPEAAGEATKHRGWIVGVFGGTEQRGRWRLARRLRILALFGGATLDLGRAEVEAPESIVTIVAFFGGVEILAPAGVPIQLDGITLLGGKSDERAEGVRLPGAPLVRLRVVAALGGVKVKARKAG